MNNLNFIPPLSDNEGEGGDKQGQQVDVSETVTQLNRLSFDNPLCLWGLYVFLFFLIYSGYIWRETLHHDDVFDFWGTVGSLYCANGRWGLAFLRSELTLGCSTYAACTLYVMLVSLVLVWQIRLIGLSTTFSKLFYGVVYISYATSHLYMMQYSMLCDALGLACLLATCAVWLIEKNSWKNVIFAALVLAIALGFYQTVGCYFVALWLLVAIRKGQFGERLAVQCMLASAMGGLFIWFCISQIVKCSFELELDMINHATAYVLNQIGWADFFAADFFGKCEQIISVLAYIFFCLCGRCHGSQWMYAIILFPLLLLSLRLISQRKWLLVSFLFVAWLMPYAQSLVLMRAQSAHTFIVEPLVLSAVWVIWWVDKEKRSYKWQVVFSVFLSFCLINSLYKSANWTKRARADYQHRLYVVQSLQQSIERLKADVEMPQADVIVFGYGSNSQGIARALPFYLPSHLKMLGISNVRYASQQEYERFAEYVALMHDYPASDSVKLVKDTILIRLRDEPVEKTAILRAP